MASVKTKKETKRTAKVSKSNVLSARETVKKVSQRIPSIKLSRTQALLIVGALLVLAVVYNFKGALVAATVNGEPISRLELVKELDKKDGKTMLDSMVTKSLIFQEAKKKNITVTQSEVDAEVKKIDENISKQGQKLDDLLAMQGMTRQDLNDQIRIQKIIEKALGNQISVSDKEITDYIEKNKATLPQDMKEDELKTNVKQQLVQQKTSEKFQTWVADLKKQAKINYFVSF